MGPEGARGGLEANAHVVRVNSRFVAIQLDSGRPC